jgi:hypothetical protein
MKTEQEEYVRVCRNPYKIGDISICTSQKKIKNKRNNGIELR